MSAETWWILDSLCVSMFTAVQFRMCLARDAYMSEMRLWRYYSLVERSVVTMRVFELPPRESLSR